MEESKVSYLAINSLGSQVAVVTAWMDGFGHALTTSKNLRVFDAHNGSLLWAQDVNGIGGVKFADDDNLEVTVGNGTWRVIRETKEWTRLNDVVAGEYAISLPDGRSILWSNVSMHVVPSANALPTFTDFVDVTAFPQDNILVTLSAGNDLTFYDLSALQRVLTIIPKRDGEWIAYSPTGDYAASSRGTLKVYWTLGDRLLPFETLSARFEHPSLLTDQIARVRNRGTTISVAASAGKNSKPHIDPRLFMIPYHVEIVGDRIIQTNDKEYRVQLRVIKEDQSLPDPILVFKQQGRDIPGETQALKTPDGSGAYVPVVQMFSLAIGTNVIDAEVEVGDAKLPGITLVITRLAQDSLGTHPPATRDLWYFGVGVDSNPNLPLLKFAAADVKDLATKLETQKGTLFNAVHTKILSNQAASARDIVVQMHDFLRMASSDDVVVIFFSGHGVQDGDSLYFMSVDADPDRPYTGIDFAEVQSLLKKRPLNQKAVLLLDICHAGALNNGASGKGLMTMSEATKELSEGTGLVVIASSTGREASLEDASYDGGHGAFAAAVLEAMSGKAFEGSMRASPTVPEKVSYLTVSELEAYVQRRVPEITLGHQHPTIPVVESFQDFPVAAP